MGSPPAEPGQHINKPSRKRRFIPGLDTCGATSAILGARFLRLFGKGFELLALFLLPGKRGAIPFSPSGCLKVGTHHYPAPITLFIRGINELGGDPGQSTPVYQSPPHM